MARPPQPTWTMRTPASDEIERLAEMIECDPLVATVLANRGLTDPADAQRFLQPDLGACHDPELLPDCRRAVDRIQRAIDCEEPITIYADRDTDGLAGATVLLTLLDRLGATIGYYVPGKYDGHGLHTEPVEGFVHRGTELLVVVDCGTTDPDAVRTAKDQGMDVVIIDHHQPDVELPPADAIVNPRRSTSSYPHEKLAAGAIAYKVGSLLVDGLDRPDRSDYDRYGLPLAALATVGDVVPLHEENRAFVHAGFERMAACDLPGIAALVDHCGVDSIRDLAWSLAPVINAGQEDESGDFVLRLLLADDRTRVRGAIPELEAYRTHRREQRDEAFEYLVTRIEERSDPIVDPVIFVEIDRYVGGGALSRVAERWATPIVAYRRKGDAVAAYARSATEIDLQELFHTCEELLIESWGHPGAGGFSVARADLDVVTERLETAVRTRYDPEDLIPTIEIEATIDPTRLTEDLVEAFEQLRPFGNGNEEPYFLLEDFEIAAIDTFGDGNRHCKLVPAARDSFSVLYWDGSEIVEGVTAPCTCDVVGAVGWDAFEERPAFVLEDIRFVDSA